MSQEIKFYEQAVYIRGTKTEGLLEIIYIKMLGL